MATYGIDLGTTYSCIAYVDTTGRPVVLKSAVGEDTTPSVGYFESRDNVVVGTQAKDSSRLATSPRPSIRVSRSATPSSAYFIRPARPSQTSPTASCRSCSSGTALIRTRSSWSARR